LSLLLSWPGYSQSGKREWLNELNQEIDRSALYDGEKLMRIDSLKKKVKDHAGIGLYDAYLQLYNEYDAFNFDSAYSYAKKMQQAAADLRDSTRMTYATVKLNFVLLSSGLFKEVFESLEKLSPKALNDSSKGEYYILLTRSYFDLEDYNHDDIFSSSYIHKAENYLDSALSVFPPNSFEFLYFSGLKNIRRGEVRKASFYFQKLVDDPQLSIHQQAIVNSTFSDVYIRRGFIDSAIILLSKASIEDIKSSTKEAVAIFNLATFLFKQGDLENASSFIQKAAIDAKNYGARQRILQLSNIMPVIEAEKLSMVERNRSSLKSYAVIITSLVVFLLIFGIVIIKQVRKLRKQQNEINDQNSSLYHLVEEKEWLIRETHHRIKNNLHTITSLLETQSAYLKEEALEAIRDTQHRVFAMSVIHQKLYQPEKNLTKINMSAYLHELINYLCDSFETSPRISFQLDFEPLELDISLAVPIGMILNEAITNSVKYAFPNHREGRISISVKKIDETKFLFTIADNGIGLRPDLDVNKGSTLGMKLIKGLCTDIAARFAIESRQGTIISIEFLADESLQRPQSMISQ
jgi:two-component sensor histidine kinase